LIGIGAMRPETGASGYLGKPRCVGGAGEN
jgi:hypothetical protein